MDYQLFYTQKALSDLSEIVARIAEDDSEAASRFGNALLDHLDLLARFPRIGGEIRKRTEVRKLIHSPILVYYKVDEAAHRIQILHLRHAARKPPGSEI